MQVYDVIKGGPAIGDQALASFFVHLLNDNGIPAVLNSEYKYILDCDYVFPNTQTIRAGFSYDTRSFGVHIKNETIMNIAIALFKKQFKINKDIQITRNFVPVKYTDLPSVKGCDVSIVSSSGPWAPVRNWPYFTELKDRLAKLNISFIDLTENKIKDNEFLNHVKKSKVFVTLETGASHIASQFVTKENSLVIQSGYCDSSFWNAYNYDVISHDTPCKWCFINIGKEQNRCFNGHACMKNIPVDAVLNKVLSKLNNL